MIVRYLSRRLTSFFPHLGTHQQKSGAVTAREAITAGHPSHWKANHRRAQGRPRKAGSGGRRDNRRAPNGRRTKGSMAKPQELVQSGNQSHPQNEQDVTCHPDCWTRCPVWESGLKRSSHSHSRQQSQHSGRHPQEHWTPGLCEGTLERACRRCNRTASRAHQGVSGRCSVQRGGRGWYGLGHKWQVFVKMSRPFGIGVTTVN